MESPGLGFDGLVSMSIKELWVCIKQWTHFFPGHFGLLLVPELELIDIF